MEITFFPIYWLIFIRRNSTHERDPVNKFHVIDLYAYIWLDIAGPLHKLSNCLLGTKATASASMSVLAGKICVVMISLVISLVQLFSFVSECNCNWIFKQFCILDI